MKNPYLLFQLILSRGAGIPFPVMSTFYIVSKNIFLLASIWGNDLPNLLLVPKYISNKVFVHNTISSFVSSLISKHPYPYFNLNTITSAADILSVDSYMSIYAWNLKKHLTFHYRVVGTNFSWLIKIFYH